MHTTTRTRSAIAVTAVLGLGLAACGSDDGDSGGAAAAEGASGDAASDATSDSAMPTIVVTTNVLGDVVEQFVGDSANVVTIMPVGTDPHDFQASAQEVDAMNTADALIVNGAAFEEGLLDVIEGAEDEGVPTFEAISAVETIEFGEGGHSDHDDDHDEDKDEEHSNEEHSDEEHSDDEEHGDEEHGDEDAEHGDDEHSDEDGEHGDEDHGDEEHGDEEHDDEDKDEDHGDEDHDEEHGDEHDDDEHSDEEHGDDEHSDEHDHSGADPHFFTDPMRMAAAVEGIADFLVDEVAFADPEAVQASADAYIGELTSLDAEVEDLVESIPEESRVLVTNHEVFGYFADRYGFEVVGAVIPSGTTTDGASAQELAELAEQIEAESVPAIFSDTSSSDDLVNALADEVGDVMVIELFTESLGEEGSDGATYVDMVRTNAERMSSALA